MPPELRPAGKEIQIFSFAAIQFGVKSFVQQNTPYRRVMTSD